MPHIDEMLGVATVASIGLFAAIALQPIDGRPAGSVVAQAHRTVPTAAAVASGPAILFTPAAEIRSSVEPGKSTHYDGRSRT